MRRPTIAAERRTLCTARWTLRSSAAMAAKVVSARSIAWAVSTQAARRLFPSPQGGYITLDNWRTREWYDALDAAGITKRGPYHLRHTFATEALAAGISIFDLARLMGASVKTIDKHYGHLARDSEERLRAALDARADRSGVYLASEPGGE